MKKEYAAPDLYFESFELTESIATGCGSVGIGDVTASMGAGLFFENTPSNYLNYTCTIYAEQVGYETYCYWTGSEENKIFLS